LSVRGLSNRHEDVFAFHLGRGNSQWLLGWPAKYSASGHVKLGKLARAGNHVSFQFALVRITSVVRAQVAQGLALSIIANQHHAFALYAHRLCFSWLKAPGFRYSCAVVHPLDADVLELLDAAPSCLDLLPLGQTLDP